MGVQCYLSQYFNHIAVVNVIDVGVAIQNHRWSQVNDKLYNKVVSSTPCHWD